MGHWERLAEREREGGGEGEGEERERDGDRWMDGWIDRQKDGDIIEIYI